MLANCNAPGDAEEDCSDILDGIQDVNEEQIRTDENQKDDFEQWSKEMQSDQAEMDYEKLTSEITEIIDKPNFYEPDYLNDNYFFPIYQFLKYDKLPEDNEKARKILLMSENYYIANNLLYKVSLPRSKKEERVRPQSYKLCIPEITLRVY